MHSETHSAGPGIDGLDRGRPLAARDVESQAAIKTDCHGRCFNEHSPRNTDGGEESQIRREGHQILLFN